GGRGVRRASGHTRTASRRGSIAGGASAPARGRAAPNTAWDWSTRPARAGAAQAPSLWHRHRLLLLLLLLERHRQSGSGGGAAAAGTAPRGTTAAWCACSVRRRG